MKAIITVFFISLILMGSTAAEPGQQKNRIKLGVIVPLTGPLAFFGNDYVRTYELVKEAHPDLTDKITVIWEDSAYDSKKAVAAFDKLVARDRVDLIFSFGGPMLSALAPLAEDKKIPFYASESEKSDCENRDYCSLFRNEENEWGQATWHVLRKNKISKIGIIKNQNQFMNTFVEAIVNTKKDHEDVEIALDLPPDASDLRSSILGLKRKKFDALGIYLLPTSHHGFLSSIKQLNKSYQLFGVEEFLVPENNKGYDDLLDGTFVIAPGATPLYTKLFQQKYGYSAGFYYTPAFYDFLTLLREVAVHSQTLSGYRLIKAMEFSGKRKGVSGEFSVKFSEKGVRSYSFPIFIYQKQKEEVKVVEEINF